MKLRFDGMGTLLMQRLPIKLQREPLVDALFEVRLSGGPSSLADLLPGFLFHDLDPKPTITRLPAANIPYPARALDPNLHFQPVFRLELVNFFVTISDRSFTVACRLPYPKWANFKKKIIEITQKVSLLGIDGKVERYSIKYTNLIAANSLSEQVSKINMHIDLGSIHVESDVVNLQVHRVTDDAIHILTVATGVEITKTDGESAEGVLVDTDSIRNVTPTTFYDFATGFESGLESLRQSNKEMFFACLKPSTIEELGAIYE